MTQPTDKPKPRARGRARVRLGTQPGASPGTLVVDAAAQKPVLSVCAYDEHEVEQRALTDPEEIRGWLGKRQVVWIDVVGLGDAEVLRNIAEVMVLHRLVIEDVVSAHQRPKVEDYEQQLFVVTRMLDGATRDSEQVSLVLGGNFLLTFRERAGDALDPVRQRIAKGGKIRRSGPDYLAYAIIDAITDRCFPVMEAFGEMLERIEDETLSAPSPRTIAAIHEAKRELLVIRRTLWPMRDMLNQILREDTDRITDNTRVYLRDCYDHAVQLIELLENYRELVSGLMDVYLSSVSHRMNEIMKVLTIIATIFIPLTFIAGVYGMNFNTAASPLNMPELNWYLGYPLCVLLMAGVALGMLLYFRRLGWLGRRRRV
jgi:magnesium transporter